LYPDQTELVEELDVNTNEVLGNISIQNLLFAIVRKWKRPREIGEGTWEFEIGEPVK